MEERRSKTIELILVIAGRFDLFCIPRECSDLVYTTICCSSLHAINKRQLSCVRKSIHKGVLARFGQGEQEISIVIIKKSMTTCDHRSEKEFVVFLFCMSLALLFVPTFT